jgi:hypothetical protein
MLWDMLWPGWFQYRIINTGGTIAHPATTSQFDVELMSARTPAVIIAKTQTAAVDAFM